MSGVWYKWQGDWVYQDVKEFDSQGKAKGKAEGKGKPAQAKGAGKEGESQEHAGKGKGGQQAYRPRSRGRDRDQIFYCQCQPQNQGYEYMRKIKSEDYPRPCKNCDVAFGRLAKDRGLFADGTLPLRGRSPARSPGGQASPAADDAGTGEKPKTTPRGGSGAGSPWRSLSAGSGHSFYSSFSASRAAKRKKRAEKRRQSR